MNNPTRDRRRTKRFPPVIGLAFALALSALCWAAILALFL
jgi:hypothetical protein